MISRDTYSSHCPEDYLFDETSAKLDEFEVAIKLEKWMNVTGTKKITLHDVSAKNVCAG